MATIKEIAEKAGVSLSTVSIVLRGNARARHISEATEQLVLQTAAELGYHPNLSARQLRGSERQPLFIALYMADDFRTPMMLRFLTGLREEMRSRADCELIIRLYTPGQLRDSIGPEVMRLFHGAILCNATEADLQALEAQKPRIPVVLYNRESETFPYVAMDNEAIGSMAAKVFLSRGHKRAVYLNGSGDYDYLRQRQEAFSREAARGGMEVTLRSCENSMEGGAYAGLAIRQEGAPDCMVAASDRIAIGALRGLEGVAIPAEMELISIGNGDEEGEQYTWPALSVIRLPMEEMAKRCFRMIESLLAGQSVTSEILPVQYIQRISCGAHHESTGGNNNG